VNGVASSTTVEAFVTGPNETLVVTDGVSQPSSAFTVGPDSLDHFEFASINNSHIAGGSFPVSVTAYDKFENIKTNYPETGDHASLSGLANSPSGCNGSGQPTLNGSNPCPASYGSITWGNGTGVGSASVTGYKANDPLNGADTSLLTATGDAGEGNVKTGSSNTFKIGPAALGSFTWTTPPAANQTAGVTFTPATIRVTAFDIYGNVKYDQSTGTFSGLGNSPRGCANDNTTVTSGGTFLCSPIYGFSWANGVASSATLKDYKAETTNLTVTQGAVSKSTGLVVGPNEPDVAPYGVTFSVQPGLSLFDAALTGPPTVFVQDPFGNPIPNRQVTMTISQFATGASSTFNAGSTAQVNTNAAGLAAFTNLKIHAASVNYKIRGTVNVNPSGTVLADSAPFDIANDLKGCNGTSPTCQGNQASSDNKTFSTVTVTSTIGVNLTGSLGTAVSTSIVAPTTLPPGVCTGLGGRGFGVSLGISGTAADFPSTTATKPTFTIVTRIDKSLVKAKPQPNGANNFDVCLGAVNILTGLTNGNACANALSDPSFPAKGGGCAVRATASDGTDAYWAVLPDAPNGAKSCLDPKVKFPVVLSKTKNGAGDVVLTTCVPYPRDPHPVGGP